MLSPYLPTFSRVVGGNDLRLRIVVGVIGSDNSFCIILFFSKDFEECVTCIKVLKHLLQKGVGLAQ